MACTDHLHCVRRIVIKATVLSAHDKGSHAEVRVKVRKVLRSGKLLLSQGTQTLYPLSWTSRGCTCPILNPGTAHTYSQNDPPLPQPKKSSILPCPTLPRPKAPYSPIKTLSPYTNMYTSADIDCSLTEFPPKVTHTDGSFTVHSPGVDYLLAGPEEIKSGRLLVTLQSVALPWRPGLDVLVTKELRRGCP